ncbi:MAG: class I SAM-dependent methyltransferase [Sphingobium sp.]
MAHEMLARPSHDEANRIQYVVALKRFLLNISEGNRHALNGSAGDAYERIHGRRPESWTEIGDALASDPFYQMWSAFTRSSQDVMWSTTERVVKMDLPRLKETAARLGRRPAGGSLDIPEDFVPPEDAFAAHIHGQPGGYLRGDNEGGFVAGAIYESGLHVFAGGNSRTASDGDVLVAGVLRERYPNFAPRTGLDMGCSAGGSTIGIASNYPTLEEMHGIDVGEGLVRYAHLRAEAMGVCVNYHQMDAGDLKFPDETFDLIYAHLLLHEASPDKNREIMREALRVLRPGGLLVYHDVPIKAADYDPFQRFLSGWQTSNNDEPFWDSFLDSDFPAMMVEAGFGARNVCETKALIPGLTRSIYILIGEKPTADGAVGVQK